MFMQDSENSFEAHLNMDTVYFRELHVCVRTYSVRLKINCIFINNNCIFKIIKGCLSSAFQYHFVTVVLYN